MVCTCVGEEGLDIGEVDLIIFYDVSKSPIRLIQRMGRTGRKRAGKIIVLLSEGKQEQIYNSAIYSKNSITVRLIKEMGNVKAQCHAVFSYSFTCFPLVYTQVRCQIS